MDVLVRPTSQPPRSSGRLLFREISSAEQLLPLLRLRHLVYSHQGYWDSQSRRVDLDAYDRHSRFVGAYFQLGNDSLALIGGARFIQADGEPFGSCVDQIVEQERLPAPATRSKSFTAQEIMDFTPAVQAAQEQQLHLVEFGRTVVHPDWQKSGLGHHLVCALYGLALNCNVGMGLALVPPRLVQFYARCGCRPMPGAGSTFYTHTELVPVVVDLNDLGECAASAREAARALKRQGQWGVTVPDTALSPQLMGSQGFQQGAGAGLRLHPQGIAEPVSQ